MMFTFKFVFHILILKNVSVIHSKTVLQVLVLVRDRHTCFPLWTLAVVIADSIMARSAVVARSNLTIVYVDRAIWTSPPIHTNTPVTTMAVDASSPIFARRMSSRTFINIHRTQRTCKRTKHHTGEGSLENK